MNPNSPQPTKGRILCLTSNSPCWQGDSTSSFGLNLAQDLHELRWLESVS